MTPHGRRTLLRHLVALGVMAVATGLGMLAPQSPLILFGLFLGAVVLAVWMGGDQVGLAATACAVVLLSIFFASATSVVSLTAFAAAGAALSAIPRVLEVGRAPSATAEPIGAPLPGEPTLGLVFGLPLLIVVMYTDISDALMRRAPVPSLLQPLIVLLAVAVFRARKTLRPATAALHPLVIAFAFYAVVVFATSIWARDVRLVDESVSEIVKALFICVLTASLAARWASLQRAFAALIATATVLAATSIIQITTGRLMNAFLGLVNPQSGTIYASIAMPRAAGPPNSDPNFYARILLIVIPLAVGLAIVHRSRPRRFVYWMAAAVITAGTLVTYSRAAMLTLGVMAALLLVGMRVRPRNIALAGAAALVVLLLMPQTISRRFLTIETLMPDYDTTFVYDSSVEKRKLLVRSGIAMFEEHPIAGVGGGNYQVHFTRFANEIGSAWIDYHPPGSAEHPHGLYFEIAAETGVIGLIAFGAIVVAALLSLERSRRMLVARGRKDHAILAMTVSIAIVSYLIASVFLHETHLRYPALLFGFAIAVARLSEDPE
jgi:putative inorganic carbon (HCO3(-)) transporter